MQPAILIAMRGYVVWSAAPGRPLTPKAFHSPAQGSENAEPWMESRLARALTGFHNAARLWLALAVIRAPSDIATPASQLSARSARGISVLRGPGSQRAIYFQRKIEIFLIFFVFRLKHVRFHG
jgi:hypothetical protein